MRAFDEANPTVRGEFFRAFFIYYSRITAVLAVYYFNHHLHGKKSFQNHNFSELAIYLTTLITVIMDANALVSCGNRVKLT